MLSTDGTEELITTFFLSRLKNSRQFTAFAVMLPTQKQRGFCSFKYIVMTQGILITKKYRIVVAQPCIR